MPDKHLCPFDEATDFLSNHGGEDPLNRLFAKNIADFPHLLKDIPKLTAQNVEVIRETKPKLIFAQLANLDPAKSARDSEGPLIIVRYRGHDRLIDGNHRCRFWHRNNVDGEHEAYVLIVKEESGAVACSSTLELGDQTVN